MAPSGAVGSLATIGYTLDNQVASVKYGNGQVATYPYTKMNQPQRILV